jgi:hypothetical protein
MSSPSQTELAQVRTKVETIANRANSDDAYLRQLRDNPRQTLMAEGLPEAAIGDVVYELGMEEEVAGFEYCHGTCTYFTCLVTSVVVKCSATAI